MPAQIATRENIISVCKPKINPKNDCNDNEEASFIPMALVTEGFHNKHTFEIKEWGTIKKGFNHLLEGDIGVAKITPCFQNRKSVVFQNLHNGFGACTTELIVIRTDNACLLNEYLLYFFKTEEFIHKGVDSFTGVVGQQRIHKDYLKMSPMSFLNCIPSKLIFLTFSTIFNV